MTPADLQVRPFRNGDRAACAKLFDRLPEWFGMPAANEKYLAGLSELPSFVAVLAEELVGFTSLRVHNPQSAEIEVLAVAPELHRQGIGGHLVDQLEEEMRGRGRFEFLHVKTLGPSMPDEGYARTRAFYRARGFVPLFETSELWGPENPALVLVRAF